MILIFEIACHLFQGQRSALLDDVALVHTETGVLCWAEGVATAWRSTGVARANLPGMLIVSFTAVAEVESGLDAGATDSHTWGIWV